MGLSERSYSWCWHGAPTKSVLNLVVCFGRGQLRVLVARDHHAANLAYGHFEVGHLAACPVVEVAKTAGDGLERGGSTRPGCYGKNAGGDGEQGRPFSDLEWPMMFVRS